MTPGVVSMGSRHPTDVNSELRAINRALDGLMTHPPDRVSYGKIASRVWFVTFRRLQEKPEVQYTRRRGQSGVQ